jgi:beta-galactosidase
MKKLIVLAAAMAALLLATGDRAEVGAPGGPRLTININDGWQYAPVDNGVTGAWQDVDLPHTWNAQDTIDGDKKYRMGVGLYLKQLDLTPAPGKRYFLRFEGANIKSWVSVNGKQAGEHRGGYTAFAYEITDLLAPGPNLIEVKVDNSLDREIMPLYCDYNFYGGIYRNVWLIETNSAAIAVTDHASPGVYLAPKQVTAERAELEFLARLTGPVDGMFVRFSLLDAAGNRLRLVEAAPAKAGEWSEARASMAIDAPHLWDGARDPYLYRVRTELILGQETIDAVDQPLGLRFYRVDPDQGFFLNGQPYRLHGVNRHQDRDGKGNAISAEDHEEDFALMAEMGVNAVRLAHYPQAELAYSITDRRGMAVWAELPFIGPTGDATGIFLDNPNFRDNLKLQLVELIRQNYNHPSIIVWGLFNELAPPGDPTPLLRELNDLAHQEDPYRLTTVATFREGSLDDVTDLTCWNQYWGWYYGPATGFGPWLDAKHRDHPERRLCMSEYGAGGSVKQHSEFNYNVYTPGPWHPENYQLYVHEVHWAAMSERPFLWATFLWNMFDFGVVKRNEGDRPNQNDKGMVTFDRKTKKDVFYFYKANWNPEPMIYIANRRFVSRRSPRVAAQVISNAGPVTLTVNGRQVKLTPAPSNVYNATVILRPGKNVVKATAAGGLSDEVEWKFLAP